MRRPPFWVLLAAIAGFASAVGWHYFPQAFSIVSLEITMDRSTALTAARDIMRRDGRGPAGFRQAASFAIDEDAQTFVELEGGGRDVFMRMLRDGVYSAYTWRVRQFREGETNETLIRFTPDGRPYGFVERLKEDAPGAALDAAAARRIAEDGARANWRIDPATFNLVEQGQERRTGGRVDHTFTYERPSPTLNEGRYRLRLVVSGDRLTEVTHFVRIPEAFTRRYRNMRSANDAIGIGSAVAMMLLYVLGGIGVGLFLMLRRRWVVWRPAAAWGAGVGLLQALATVNEWPLMWMSYDTALPRTTFLTQQIAIAVATFIGFAVFFALSFMAAETLTRRAFGSHPQLWRVWSKQPGSSVSMLGRTAGGYLLVSVFFAYDVVLYLVATRAFGWWAPSEALLHPDVLAAHVPWFSAIANSFQAGFWEESLFRAVPLAGAALIGDRFGKRKLFLILGFIVQAAVFGAGHAPYPTQPSYARPVELILPSIGFGLLYLYFGLLPGIILHFTFDVVWFSLPIFVAKAPGIWIQQVMVVLVTLVPLWVVFSRRVQVGRWTELSPEDRNAAWQSSAAPEPAAPAVEITHHALSPRVRTAWLAIGAVSLIGCAYGALTSRNEGKLTIGRTHAADIARHALEVRGVALGPQWRVLPVPDDGSGGPNEFVSETAGEERRKQLVGAYLPKQRWVVYVKTFEGDVAARAEEWQAFVTDTGEVRTVRHTLPEDRPGATLDENAARTVAVAALRDRTGLDPGRGQAREISARPSKLKARTDWNFTFVDTTIPALPKGEPRVEVSLAGDEVVGVGRFVYVPEDWERLQRAAFTRTLVLRIVSGLVFGGLLVTAAVIGVVSWSRRRYAPRLFLLASAMILLVSIAGAVNGWPTVMASLQTALPLQLQVAGLIGLGLVGVAIASSLAGLAIGAMPARLARTAALDETDVLRFGVVAGVFGAAVMTLANALRTPPWANAPWVEPLGTFVPFLTVALGPVAPFVTRTALILSILIFVEISTAGWTRRRALAALVVAIVGFLGAGAPEGLHSAPWIAGGAVAAAGLLVLYLSLLRADLTMTPMALGTMMAIGELARGAHRSFPGALAASVAAAAIVWLLGWWWMHALRRAVHVHVR